MRSLTCLLVVLGFLAPLAQAADDKPKPLPPGLEQKIERGGELPPGWQKKLIVGERLDPEIFHFARVLEPVDRDGIITVQIEDERLRLIQSTLEIVSILTR